MEDVELEQLNQEINEVLSEFCGALIVASAKCRNDPAALELVYLLVDTFCPLADTILLKLKKDGTDEQ